MSHDPLSPISVQKAVRRTRLHAHHNMQQYRHCN